MLKGSLLDNFNGKKPTLTRCSSPPRGESPWGDNSCENLMIRHSCSGLLLKIMRGAGAGLYPSNLL